MRNENPAGGPGPKRQSTASQKVKLLKQRDDILQRLGEIEAMERVLAPFQPQGLKAATVQNRLPGAMVFAGSQQAVGRR